MKRMKKVCAVMLGVAMLVGVTASAAVSNSGSQDGIQAVIQTDKNSYAANEDIQVNITVTNTNGHTVKNVSIEGLLPDDLTLKDGSLQSDTVNLGAGETLTLDCVAVLEKEIVTDPETTEPETTEPDTTEPATEPPTEPESSTELPTESEPVVTEPIEPTTETTEPEETETDATLPETTTEETTTSESTTEEPSTVEPTTTEPTTVEPSTDLDTTVPETEEPSTEEDTTDGGIILPIEPTTDRNSPSTTESDSSTENTPANPNTSDSSTVIKVLACLAVAGAVVVAIVVIQKKNSKKATRVISLVLCGAIAISGIATTGFLSVSAEEDNSRSFTVQTVVTVDGGDYTLEGKVNYEVSATEEGDVKLYSDPKELSTSDDPQDVLFYIDTENTTGACDVTLFNAENGKELTSMQDNGKNGDKTSGDGIYSTTISVDCSEETTVQYYAVVDDGITKVKSKVREINIFAPMTDEEAENMTTVDNRLIDLTKSSEYVNASDDDKASYMKETLENMLDKGMISDYQFLNDDAMVSYTYPGGITAYWNIIPQEQNLGLSPEAFDSLINNLSLNDVRSLKLAKSNQQMLYDEILFIYGWENNFDKRYTSIAQDFNQANHPTKCEYLPTVEEYKTLLTERNYQYILIAEHGGKVVDDKRNYLTTYIGTGETITLAKNEQYSNDLKERRILKVDGEYGLLSSFFSFYYENELGGAIIDMESCMGVGTGSKENYDYSSAFLYDCGASTYIGYHNSVAIAYSLMMSINIIEGLTSKNMNVGQAYVYAVDICGTTDVEFMYEYGPELDPNWLVPDKETGKTNYEVIKEQDESGMAAYPVLLGDSKTTLNATVKFAGGNGSLNDPYQIATAQQLDGVRYHLDSNFVLVDDIDLSEYENWEPIGGYIDVEPGDGLQGSFDGQGHTISNLKMDYTITPTGESYPSYYFGLFSDSTLSPGIKNVKLENVDINISGTGDMIGNSGSTNISISGLSTNASVLSNINVSGLITASLHCNDLNIGGIATKANRIINATNRTNIDVEMTSLGYIASAYIGGVVSNNGSVLNNCSNYGNIYGEISDGSGLGSRPRTSIYCGGIASISSDAQITNCKNFGAIEGNTEEDAEVGGIVGTSSADNVALCSNYGVVSARSYSNGDSMVGGIIGNASSISRQGTVRQCANFGKITSICTLLLGEPDSAYCGGITGNSWATNSVKLEECYNLASELEAVCRTSSEEKESNIGRISGVPLEYDGSTNISNCYSVDSTLMNGLPAMDEIGPDQKNGGSMTRAEIEKAVTDLGFELPVQAQYIVWKGIPQTVLSTKK